MPESRTSFTSGITLRALLIGTLLVIGNAYWLAYAAEMIQPQFPPQLRLALLQRYFHPFCRYRFQSRVEKNLASQRAQHPGTPRYLHHGRHGIHNRWALNDDFPDRDIGAPVPIRDP